jgi:sporulation protein YlmC with PRC-barrel domain
MRLSSLIAAEVVTEDGESLGHVYDVRARLLERSVDGYRWRVSGLVIGSRGVRERLGLDTARTERPIARRDLIDWDSVVEIDEDEGRVTVRRGPRA